MLKLVMAKLNHFFIADLDEAMGCSKNDVATLITLIQHHLTLHMS